MEPPDLCDQIPSPSLEIRATRHELGITKVNKI